MSDSLNSAEQAVITPERRAQIRQSIRSLAYVDLGFGNGGIILNVSESGLAVRSVSPLMESSVPKISFRPSATKPPIEVGGDIVWKSEANTMVGIRFLELPENSRAQIREWIALEAAPVDASAPRARYSFEARTPKSITATASSADALAAVPKSLAVPREALAEAASSVIPIRMPDPARTDTAAPIVPFSVLSIDAEGPPLSTESESTTAEQPAPWKQSPRRTAGFIALFAAVSLAAGWAVGRGILNRSSARNQSPSLDDSASALDPTAAPTVNFAIEVVDSNDRRWLVPLNGPSSSPGSQYRQNSQQQSQSSAPANSTANSAPSNNALGLRIWAPSAPIVSKNPAGQLSPDSAAATAPPSIDVKEPAAPPIRNVAPNLVPPAVRASTGYRDGQLSRRVDPVYPELAKELHVEGVVKLLLQVAADGKVGQVQVLGGPKLLVPAAVAAVRQWRYQPSLLDGKPTEAEKQIDVQFHLPR